jgi:hypothetical protein
MRAAAHALFALAFVAAAPFTVLVACGGSEPQPASPASAGSPATSATPATSSSAPAASASGSASPLATVLTTDGSQQAAIAAAAASAPAPTAQPPGSSADLEKGLVASAAKAAPGMKPEGDVVAGSLKQGEHLAWTVTMKPGRCYALVGWSPKGEVVDLDLHLLAPPLYMMLAGEDETDDNAPVVGRHPNAMCPVFDVGMPYKVDMTAQKGQGRVAVQLFSKPR